MFSTDVAMITDECIPPGEKQLLKVTHDAGMTNKVYIDKIKQEISIPPSSLDKVTWSQNLPQVLKDELREAQKDLYGDWVSNVEPDCYRMCW
jgi:hypothetical protein